MRRGCARPPPGVGSAAGSVRPAAGACLRSFRFGTGGRGMRGEPRGYRYISVPGRNRSTCPKAARTRGSLEQGTQPKHLPSRYPPFALLPRAHLWYREQVSSGRDGRSVGPALAAAGGGSGKQRGGAERCRERRAAAGRRELGAARRARAPTRCPRGDPVGSWSAQIYEI